MLRSLNSVFFNSDVFKYKTALDEFKSASFAEVDLLNVDYYYGLVDRECLFNFAINNTHLRDAIRTYGLLPCLFLVDKASVYDTIDCALRSKGYLNICWFHHSCLLRNLTCDCLFSPLVPTDFIQCVICNGVLYEVKSKDKRVDFYKSSLSNTHNDKSLFNIVKTWE